VRESVASESTGGTSMGKSSTAATTWGCAVETSATKQRSKRESDLFICVRGLRGEEIDLEVLVAVVVD